MISDCLIKRNHIYYFRLRIPQDIEPYFLRKEIWKSLKTRDHKSAKTTMSKLLYSTERLFLHLRSGMFTDTQMKQLVKDYLQGYLDRCESIRSIGMVRYETAGQQPVGTDAGVQGIVDASVAAIDGLIESSKRMLMLNDFSSVGVRVGWYIKDKGLAVDVGSVEYTTLCREILKAEIEALKVEKERMSGNYDNRYDNFLENTITPPVQVPLATLPQDAAPSVVMLSQVIADNIKEADLAGSWTEKTKAENESIYRVLVEILGDRDVRTITYQDLVVFRDKLAKMPANREKKPAYKGKTVDQILAMRRVEPISVSTLNKYLIRVSSLFKWAAKRQYILVNYSEGLTLPKNRKAEDERAVYAKEDIQRIIDSLVADASKPENFWIPLVGLYSGMRLDEICQLHLADVVTVDDILCFNINDNGGKKLKTLSSVRVVPVHPMLLRLGFHNYVDGLRKKGKEQLWVNLRKSRDGHSQDFGKWYQRFNRKFVTKDPKKVFHSFRHTLANNLKQIGVQEVTIAEILGHANESMTMSRYGKRYEPKVLMEALKQLDYGVTIPGLKI
jgi:integrase